MPAPINWESKIILVKTEVTEGVDAAPTGGANAFLMTNVSFVPMEGDDVSRGLELPYLGAESTVPNALRGRLKGRVELVPSGTAGLAPKWGPMLRACAVAETVVAATSVTYNPVSTGHESVTIHFWIGGTRHVLTGARGTANLRGAAQGIPVIEFDLLGLYTPPSETARAVPDLSGFQSPDLVSKAKTTLFTVNAVPLVLRDFALNLGNKVEPRLLVPTERIIITARADSFSATVEAVPLTTFDPFALAVAQTRVAVALTHGTVAGRIVSLAIPGAQVKRLSGFENQQKILEWPLDLTPLPVTGNDQWTLTLT